MDIQQAGIKQIAFIADPNSIPIELVEVQDYFEFFFHGTVFNFEYLAWVSHPKAKNPDWVAPLAL